MGERDAFGRERAENPLAAMGWGAAEDRMSRAAPIAAVGAADTAAPVATVAAAPPPRAAVPPRRPVRIRTRRRTPVLLRLIVPLMAVVVALALVAGQSSTGSRGGTIAVPIGQPDTPSLLGPAALRAALRQVPRGRLQYLRVAPGGVTAQVIRRGKLHLVTVDAAGGVADTTVAVAIRAPRLRVNAAAPRRIETRLKHVAYLLLGVHGWDVFTAGGRQYRADLSGRHVHRGG